jgi:hypothetical protein
MNQKVADHPCSVAFDRERLLALSSLLKNSSPEIESQVQGGSMGAVLPDGSQIRIRIGAVDTFVPGQIVTYIAKDRIIAHRLVQSVTSYDGHYVITRGDATLCCDAPVRTSSVIGVVTEFRKNGSWQPVGPPAARGRGSQLIASVMSAMVVALLRLNPQISCWAVRRIFQIRRAVMRSVGFARRFTEASSLAGKQS